MRVIICGSRDWDDYTKIREYVETLPKDTIIIEGGARGADKLARNAAIQCGLKYETYNANWDRYGRSAGPKRNQEMLDSGAALVVGFRKNMSRGTTDMLDRAAKAGTPTKIVDIP